MQNEAELQAILDGAGGIDDINPEEEALRNEAYRVLLNRTLDMRDMSERGEECVSEVTEVIEEANKLAEKVRFSSTLHLDALVLHGSSVTLKNCTDRIGNLLNEYKGADFASRLLPCHQSRTAPKEQNKMKVLENWTMKFFSIGICYYFEQKEVMKRLSVVTQKIRKQARRRENLEALPIKKPQIVEVAPQKEDLADFYIKIIMEAIITKQNKTNAPVPLLLLVVNPNSYTETVENLFYFAHVVREGLVEVFTDEDGLPVVKALSEDEDSPPEKRGKKDAPNFLSRHAVYKMEKADWKQIIKAYTIKKPLIPSRGKNK